MSTASTSAAMSAANIDDAGEGVVRIEITTMRQRSQRVAAAAVDTAAMTAVVMTATAIRSRAV